MTWDISKLIGIYCKSRQMIRNGGSQIIQYYVWINNIWILYESIRMAGYSGWLWGVSRTDLLNSKAHKQSKELLTSPVFKDSPHKNRPFWKIPPPPHPPQSRLLGDIFLLQRQNQKPWHKSSNTSNWSHKCRGNKDFSVSNPALIPREDLLYALRSSH